MLVYFTANWYILWPFGIFNGYLVYFPRFGMMYIEKSGNPGAGNWSEVDFRIFSEKYLFVDQG
jgi:hypothetical protein